MKSPTPLPKLPLIAFFEGVYRPLALRDRAKAYVDQFVVAIGWLAAIIGRDPVLGDLTRDTMTDFLARLPSLGMAPLTMRNYRRRLWSIWRYAHKIGYAERPPSVDQRRKLPSYCHHGATGQAYVQIDGKRIYLGKYGGEASRLAYLKILVGVDPLERVPLPPEAHRPQRAWNVPRPPAGSLLHFYRTAFRPQLALDASSREITRFDCGINYLHDFIGDQVQLDQVTPELVEGFRVWLDGTPITAQQRTAYRTAIRRIMLASPFAERFAKGEGELVATARPGVGERKTGPHGDRGPRRLPPLVGEPGTLLHFFTATYAVQAIAHCSELHHRAIESGFRSLRRCFGRDLRLDELSREKIAEFQAWLRDSGMGPISIKNIVTRLLAVWRFANELDQAPAVPRFRRVRITREQPDAWSLDELARILDAAGRLERVPIGGIPAPAYWRAILLVCYWTALRRGSLMKIRTADVNLEQGTLYVPGSQMKNGRGKMFHLGSDAVAAIRVIHDPERELLFPSPGDLKTLSDQFRSIIAAAGVPKSRRHNGLFHKLRRTTITHTAARAGMPAAIALAGHSSQYVTERYLDPSFLPDHDATAWLPSIGTAPIPGH